MENVVILKDTPNVMFPCTNVLDWHAHNAETDNTALSIIKKKFMQNAKSSYAPPNQYKATLCTTKVYIGTLCELV